MESELVVGERAVAYEEGSVREVQDIGLLVRVVLLAAGRLGARTAATAVGDASQSESVGSVNPDLVVGLIVVGSGVSKVNQSSLDDDRFAVHINWFANNSLDER